MNEPIATHTTDIDPPLHQMEIIVGVGCRVVDGLEATAIGHVLTSSSVAQLVILVGRCERDVPGGTIVLKYLGSAHGSPLQRTGGCGNEIGGIESALLIFIFQVVFHVILLFKGIVRISKSVINTGPVRIPNCLVA